MDALTTDEQATLYTSMENMDTGQRAIVMLLMRILNTLTQKEQTDEQER